MTKQSRAELYLLLLGFIWASTFVIFKFLLNYLSPFLFLVLRYFIATIIFYFLFRNQLQNFSKTSLKKGISLGILVGIGIVIQTIGLTFTTASKAAFITGMMVVFTPFAQIFIIKKKPNIANVIGIAVVILGLYFLTYPIETNINKGDLMVLCGSILFGIYIVYLDVYSRDENIYKISFLQMITTGVIALFALPTESIKFIFNFDMFTMLAYMIIFATIITTYVQTNYQKDTTPTKAVLIFSVEPVIASILAFYFLSERIGTMGVIGGGLIILGILISEFIGIFFKKLNHKNI